MNQIRNNLAEDTTKPGAWKVWALEAAEDTEYQCLAIVDSNAIAHDLKRAIESTVHEAAVTRSGTIQMVVCRPVNADMNR